MPSWSGLGAFNSTVDRGRELIDIPLRPFEKRPRLQEGVMRPRGEYMPSTGRHSLEISCPKGAVL